MDKEKTILIVDDMEINRIILAEIFKDNYIIIQACDGNQAIETIKGNVDISAVLLDLIMPGTDGLGVLRDMKKSGKIKNIPVFLITAEENEKMLIEGYHLGAVDVIRKPFMSHFLKHRINNIIELYAHRNDLANIVEQQVAKLNKLNQSMIEMLATAVEFRDCESGEHVKRIAGFTKLLMTEVSSRYPEYYMTEEEIDKISKSSVLHDVGKISIPDSILTKPGRLTSDEYEIMKQHTVKGYEFLMQFPDIIDESTYKYSCDICRYHHERWDGKGYPDGLAGDDIPIWAQVVSVADVYDALTAERVYKKPFSHEKAVSMIKNGECGMFNPKLIDAFEALVNESKSGETE